MSSSGYGNAIFPPSAVSELLRVRHNVAQVYASSWRLVKDCGPSIKSPEGNVQPGCSMTKQLRHAEAADERKRLGRSLTDSRSRRGKGGAESGEGSAATEFRFVPTVKDELVMSDEYVEFWVTAFPDLYEPWAARVLFALRVIARRETDRANGWLMPFGITIVKYRYLAYLYAARGRACTLSELKEQLSTSHPSVNEMVTALEAQHLVEVITNPTDRRSFVVHLTDAGTRLFEKALPAYEHGLAQAMYNLSMPERRKLLKLLLKLGQGVQSASVPALLQSASEPKKQARRPAKSLRGA